MTILSEALDTRLSKIERELKEIRAELDGPNPLPEDEEDWIRANLKRGGLVEVRDDSRRGWVVSEYAGVSDFGDIFGRGVDASTTSWLHARLPRNRWLPHLGGAMPVPGWMRVDALVQTKPPTTRRARAGALIWSNADLTAAITAYRIPEDQ